MRRFPFALAAVLTAAGLVVACGGTSPPGSAAAPAPAVVQTAPPATAAPLPPGAALYTQSCARCHGFNLQGKGATPAIDQLRLSGLGDQRLRLTIASGKGQMPAFGGLSPTQVDALVSYLQEMAA